MSSKELKMLTSKKNNNKFSFEKRIVTSRYFRKEVQLDNQFLMILRLTQV